MQIRYSLSFAHYAAAQVLHAKRGVFPYFSYLMGYYLFPALGFGILALVLLTTKPSSLIHSNWIALLCGTYLLLCPLILRQAAKRRFKRSSSGAGDCTIDLDYNQIRMQGPHSKGEIEWDAIQSYSEDKSVFLLYLAPGKFIVVPTRVCSEYQVSELGTILTQKVQRVA
ncbi:MAG: YcxB family protein [Terracidiphilus sp.]|jgi:hypothetical protein